MNVVGGGGERGGEEVLGEARNSGTRRAFVSCPS